MEAIKTYLEQLSGKPCFPLQCTKENFDFFHISSPICICNDLLLFFLQLELMVVHEKTECITVLESRALELQIV